MMCIKNQEKLTLEDVEEILYLTLKDWLNNKKEIEKISFLFCDEYSDFYTIKKKEDFTKVLRGSYGDEIEIIFNKSKINLLRNEEKDLIDKIDSLLMIFSQSEWLDNIDIELLTNDDKEELLLYKEVKEKLKIEDDNEVINMKRKIYVDKLRKDLITKLIKYDDRYKDILKKINDIKEEIDGELNKFDVNDCSEEVINILYNLYMEYSDLFPFLAGNYYEISN